VHVDHQLTNGASQGADQSSRANSMTLLMAGLCRNSSAIAGVSSQSNCAAG
jgi:hypothetical protein